MTKPLRTGPRRRFRRLSSLEAGRRKPLEELRPVERQGTPETGSSQTTAVARQYSGNDRLGGGKVQFTAPPQLHWRGYAVRHTDITASRSQRCAGSASTRGCHIADILNSAVGTGSSKLSRPDVVAWSLARLLPRHERGTSAIKSEWRAIRIASGYPGTTTGIARRRPRFSNASSTGSMTSPSRDATTWLQAAYRSSVTPVPARSGCPIRATPTSLS